MAQILASRLKCQSQGLDSSLKPQGSNPSLKDSIRGLNLNVEPQIPASMLNPPPKKNNIQKIIKKNIQSENKNNVNENKPKKTKNRPMYRQAF